MTALRAVAAGLQGAAMLAGGKPEGVARIGNDARAVWLSFWAMALCLPVIVCIRLLAWSGTGIPAGAAVIVIRYAALFAVGWLLFMVVSHPLAGLLGKGASWPRCIAVWAYCSVIGNGMILLGDVVGSLGAPAMLGQLSTLVAFGWAMWLEWFGIRLTLGVSATTAIALVSVDNLIGIILAVIGGVLD